MRTTEGPAAFFFHVPSHRSVGNQLFVSSRTSSLLLQQQDYSFVVVGFALLGSRGGAGRGRRGCTLAAEAAASWRGERHAATSHQEVGVAGGAAAGVWATSSGVGCRRPGR